MVEVDQLPERDELEHRMIETEIQDLADVVALPGQRFGQLQQDGRLTDPAWPGEQNGAAEARVLQPRAAGLECDPRKRERRLARATCPPGIESVQNALELVRRKKGC